MWPNFHKMYIIDNQNILDIISKIVNIQNSKKYIFDNILISIENNGH